MQIIKDKLEVKYSNDEKSCYLVSDDSVLLKNSYWSEDVPYNPDYRINSGNFASASINFLKLICKLLDVEIAIQVNIRRTYEGNRNKQDELGYIPESSKTFILSEDGKLRDTRNSYQFR